MREERKKIEPSVQRAVRPLPRNSFFPHHTIIFLTISCSFFALRTNFHTIFTALALGLRIYIFRRFPFPSTGLIPANFFVRLPHLFFSFLLLFVCCLLVRSFARRLYFWLLNCGWLQVEVGAIRVVGG